MQACTLSWHTHSARMMLADSRARALDFYVRNVSNSFAEATLQDIERRLLLPGLARACFYEFVEHDVAEALVRRLPRTETFLAELLFENGGAYVRRVLHVVECADAERWQVDTESLSWVLCHVALTLDRGPTRDAIVQHMLFHQLQLWKYASVGQLLQWADECDDDLFVRLPSVMEKLCQKDNLPWGRILGHGCRRALDSIMEWWDPNASKGQQGFVSKSVLREAVDAAPDHCVRRALRAKNGALAGALLDIGHLEFPGGLRLCNLGLVDAVVASVPVQFSQGFWNGLGSALRAKPGRVFYHGKQHATAVVPNVARRFFWANGIEAVLAKRPVIVRALRVLEPFAKIPRYREPVAQAIRDSGILDVPLSSCLESNETDCHGFQYLVPFGSDIAARVLQSLVGNSDWCWRDSSLLAEILTVAPGLLAEAIDAGIVRRALAYRPVWWDKRQDASVSYKVLTRSDVAHVNLFNALSRCDSHLRSLAADVLDSPGVRQCPVSFLKVLKRLCAVDPARVEPLLAPYRTVWGVAGILDECVPYRRWNRRRTLVLWKTALMLRRRNSLFQK